MALIKCPDCGKEISSLAEKCPYCGRPMKKGASHNVNSVFGKEYHSRTIWGFVVSGFVLLLGIVMIVIACVSKGENGESFPGHMEVLLGVGVFTIFGSFVCFLTSLYRWIKTH